MSKLSFFGAAGAVTGSNFLIETRENSYVVDCGLFQGLPSLTQLNDDDFAYKPNVVDALIVTHAHLDHIGRIPKLVRDGFRGPIYATQPTIELMALTLKDALGLMDHRSKQDGKPMLYEEEDVRRTIGLCQAVNYKARQPLKGDDAVIFYDAGHILGSASVLVEAEGKKFAFSGDVGHSPNILLPHSEAPPSADVVVTEATYGGVEHSDGIDRERVLLEAIEWTIQNRGVLLIPAFAIERSQELLYLLNDLFNARKLPRIPIFFDSPLAIEALEVFERHKRQFSAQVKEIEKKDPEIFSFRGLVLTPTVEDSKDISDQPPPKVIIAGSGMMEGGRISHHLKRYLPFSNTLLLVIGYQAEGTLGRRIIEGDKEVNINGDRIPVRATIKVFDMFSGHADNSDMVDWVTSIKPSSGRQKIFIVHSDPERARAFKVNLAKALPEALIDIARLNQTVEI
jgi:metallo-beta-lactamase family protein